MPAIESVKARLISTQGGHLEAEIWIDGTSYFVIDELTLDERQAPQPGEEFDYQFSNVVDESESWESILNGNPDRISGVERVQGWEYRCFGKVVQIDPVIVDCGLFRQERVFDSHDPKVVGEFVAFTVTMLGGYRV